VSRSSLFRKGTQAAIRFAAIAAVLVCSTTPALSKDGRPSGAQAAPYLPTTVAGAPSTTLVVAPGRVLIDGKGFGHGVGLAQDGAYWMGKSGKSVGQILQLFFPGTTLSKRGGVVRVPLSSLDAATVVLPSGGTAGSLKISSGGAVRLVSGNGVVSANSATPPPVAPTTIARAGAADSVIGGGGRFAVPLPETPADPTPTIPPSAEPTTSVAQPAASLPDTPDVTIPQTDDTDSSPSSPDSEKPKRSPGVTAGTIRVTAGKGGVVVLGTKRYRGSIDFIASSTGMKIVNELDVEQYLRGMAEVTDPKWPAAAHQAQAVVARTYAMRMMGTRGEVCPTQKCQVYVGAQVEFPEQDAAIAATAGKVVVYKGELANTFYSASGGGTIADPAEVFGPGIAIPYLKAGTYPTGDPKAWHVEMSMADLARRVGYPGTLFDVFVSNVGPSGRAVEVTFSGSSGLRSMTGPKFDKNLGLRSTNFRLIVGRSAAGAPTSVGGVPGGVVQSLDDALAASANADSNSEFQSDLLGGPTSISLTDSTPLTDSTSSTGSTLRVESSTTSIAVPPTVAQSTVAPSTVAPSTVARSPTTRLVGIPQTTLPLIRNGNQTEQVAAPASPEDAGTASIDVSVVLKYVGGSLAGLIALVWVLRWGMRPEQRRP
jgi:SpoIID/LytB domain protein